MIKELWNQNFQNKFKYKKSFGQHFLYNTQTAKKIVDLIDDSKNSTKTSFQNILEVGPGAGALTEHIIQKYENTKITIVEIDKEIADFYKNILDKKAEVFHEDAKTFTRFGENTVIISNLPYNISKILLINWCRFNNIEKIVVMVQKEVAESICSKKQTKEYRFISIITQYYFSCRKIFDLDPKSFFPVPKVVSSVIILERKREANSSLDKFIEFTKHCFSQRRKKMSNVCRDVGPEFFDLRPEDLSPEDFFSISQNIEIKK